MLRAIFNCVLGRGKKTNGLSEKIIVSGFDRHRCTNVKNGVKKKQVRETRVFTTCYGLLSPVRLVLLSCQPNANKNKSVKQN